MPKVTTTATHSHRAGKLTRDHQVAAPVDVDTLTRLKREAVNEFRSVFQVSGSVQVDIRVTT